MTLYLQKIFLNSYLQKNLLIDFTPTDPVPFHNLIITGPNGSGKTNLLKAIALELSSTQSKLSLDINPPRPFFDRENDNYIEFYKKMTEPIVELDFRPSNIDFGEKKLPLFWKFLSVYRSIGIGEKLHPHENLIEKLTNLYVQRNEQINNQKSGNLSQAKNLYEQIIGLQIDLNNKKQEISDLQHLTNKEDKIQELKGIVFDYENRISTYRDNILSLLKEKDPYQISWANYFSSYFLEKREELAYATINDEKEKREFLESWFNQWELNFQYFFENPDLKFKHEFDFKSKEKKCYFLLPNEQKFSFLDLSQGQGSIFNIVGEIILIQEVYKWLYNIEIDPPGIILIDEIEAHLHISLQKKILSILVRMFPRLQFIVTTHSPFVLSSIENTVCFDLKEQIKVGDLTSYSYSAIVETYFDQDKYSHIIKEKVMRFECLLSNSSKTSDEIEELYALKKELLDSPKIYSEELDVKIKQLMLNNLSELK